MRVGLDLRNDTGERGIARAKEADEVGLWALLVGGPPGTEANAAAQLAAATEHVHLAMWITADSAHPHTLAEEVAIVDHLSRRRALAIIDGDPGVADHVRALLGGQEVEGQILAPSPAQTVVPVWSPAQAPTIALTGDLGQDRIMIDSKRDEGVSHLFVAWPGDLAVLARHLVTRAATNNFPQIVADQADIVAPYSSSYVANGHAKKGTR